MADDNPHPIDRAFLTDDPRAGTLILVRHGQQEWPDAESATVADWVDPPLSDLGRRQASAVADYLSTVPISAVYSSPLNRAHDTGLAIAGRHEADLETIEELREVSLYGDLPPDSRPVDVLGPKLVSGARERFYSTRRWDSYPHGETSAAFRRRVGLAVEAAIADHPAETVVVACHAGVINAYLAEALGLAEDMFYRPAHASVHRVRFKEDRRIIHSLNETIHLERNDLLSF